LYNDEVCYVSELKIESDVPPPGLVQIFLANSPAGPWRQVLEKKTESEKTHQYF